MPLGPQSALFEAHQAIHPPQHNTQRRANETDFRERPKVLYVCLSSRCLCLPPAQQFVQPHPSQSSQAQQSTNDRTSSISDIRAATAKSPSHPVMAKNNNSSPEIPIIIVLGPPGSGKGTICAQLAEDFGMHHLSVGDWLRRQAVPPIAGVPDHINEYVFNGSEVPSEVVEAEYGREEDAPAPLILYNCSKRNCSTPESMKCKLMSALKDEIDKWAGPARSDRWCRWHDRPRAVLLDNLTSTLAHAEAAAETFGRGLRPWRSLSIAPMRRLRRVFSRAAEEAMMLVGSCAGSHGTARAVKRSSLSSSSEVQTWSR